MCLCVDDDSLRDERELSPEERIVLAAGLFWPEERRWTAVELQERARSLHARLSTRGEDYSREFIIVVLCTTFGPDEEKVVPP